MSRDFWQTYKNKLNTNGTNQKDRIITSTQRIITDKFSDSPSVETVTINGTSQDVRITDENSLFKNPNKKRIVCKPDESISTGDLVVWDSENWLCTDVDDIEVYVRGIIEKCNSNLKYLDSEGETVTVPCIVTDRVLLDIKDFKASNYYILPNNEIWVIVDSNGDTTPIELFQRFILGGNAYKVEGIDNISKDGLITLKMQLDNIVEDDNLVLGIANYTSNLHTYSIIILDGTEKNLSLGDTMQLEVECTDNSEVVTSPTVSYSLVTGSTGIISVTTSGLVSGVVIGSGSVIATYNSATDSININVVTSATSSFTYSLLGNIQPDNEIKTTKIYTANKYYSTGTLFTSSQFEFTITLGTATTTSSFLLSTSSDNTCSLQRLLYPCNITLVATDVIIPANNISKVISLKGLI